VARSCDVKDCPLSGCRVVPYEGNINAEIMAVGESPGAQEIRFGRPFFSDAPAGKKVRELSKLAGLPWNDLFITNSARCLIPKDKMSVKDITKVLKSCRCHLVRAVRRVQPKAIIVFGDIALQQVLGKKGIKKARGRWHWSEEFNCWVLPTYHPAFVLRQASFGKLVVGDLKMVVDFIKNNYKPVKNREVLSYRNVKSIKAFLEAAKNKRFRIGIDTETQGLDWTDPNFLTISYSMSFKKGSAVNVILFEEGTEKKHDFTITWPRSVGGSKKKVPITVYVRKADNFDQKIDELEELLDNPKIKKYMTNGNHDVHAFRWLLKFSRKRVPRVNGYVMDIQAAVHLIDENIYQLADLSLIQRNFTDFEGDYKGEFGSRYDKEDMLGVLTQAPDDYRFYACADSDVTRRAGITIRQWFKKHPRQANYFIKFTMPTLMTLMVMEEIGALIDAKQLPKVEKEIEGLLEAEEKACLELVPKEVKDAHVAKGLKLTRDFFIRDILFGEDGFGLQVLKKTKGGEPSCDKDVRKLLLDKPLRKAPRNFLIHYNEWNELHTLLTRYIKGFEKNIKSDGRIHSKWSLAIATTGRVSSRNPNMMNNPKRSKSAEKIRKLICAADGYDLVALDASQSELRWLAHVANEPEMIKIFKNHLMDIHTETAKLLVRAAGKRWRDLDEKEIKKYRFRAKAVNFGLIYGMGLHGFIRYAKTEYDLDLSEKEGAAWIAAYFDKYKGVPKYHKRIVAICKADGEVESPLGRIRRLPEIHAFENVLKAEAERQAMNHPIQEPSSSACLMACNAMVRKLKLLESNDLLSEPCRPVLFIHDDLTFEVKSNKVKHYTKMIKYEMEHPPLKEDFEIDFKVPLVAEAKVGKNLAEMKELKV
jgi:uracil-DNA glycosylase family 4